MENSSNSYEQSNISIFIQFTVYISSNNLSNLLKILNKREINILASKLDINNHKKQVFKFIVGKDNKQSPKDIETIQTILDNKGFRYEKNKVIKTNFTNNSALLSSQYSSLVQNLDVTGFYYAEDGGIIYEVCCPIKAIQALNKLIY